MDTSTVNQARPGTRGAEALTTKPWEPSNTLSEALKQIVEPKRSFFSYFKKPPMTALSTATVNTARAEHARILNRGGDLSPATALQNLVCALKTAAEANTSASTPPKTEDQKSRAIDAAFGKLVTDPKHKENIRLALLAFTPDQIKEAFAKDLGDGTQVKTWADNAFNRLANLQLNGEGATSIKGITAALSEVRSAKAAIAAIEAFSRTNPLAASNALASTTPDDFIDGLKKQLTGSDEVKTAIANAAYTALVKEHALAQNRAAVETQSQYKQDIAELRKSVDAIGKDGGDQSGNLRQLHNLRSRLQNDASLDGTQRNEIRKSIEELVLELSPKKISADTLKHLIYILPPARPDARLPPLEKLKFLRTQGRELAQMSDRAAKTKTLTDEDRATLKAEIAKLRDAWPGQVKDALLEVFKDHPKLDGVLNTSTPETTRALFAVSEFMLRFTSETLTLFVKQISDNVKPEGFTERIQAMARGDLRALTEALSGAAWDEVRWALLSEFAPTTNADGTPIEPEAREVKAQIEFNLSLVSRHLNDLYGTTLFTSDKSPDVILKALHDGAHAAAKVNPADINLQLANWAILTSQVSGKMDPKELQSMLGKIGIKWGLAEVQKRINEGFSNTADVLGTVREVRSFCNNLRSSAEAIAAVKMAGLEGVQGQALAIGMANKVSGRAADSTKSHEQNMADARVEIANKMGTLVSTAKDLDEQIDVMEKDVNKQLNGKAEVEKEFRARERALNELPQIKGKSGLLGMITGKPLEFGLEQARAIRTVLNLDPEVLGPAFLAEQDRLLAAVPKELKGSSSKKDKMLAALAELKPRADLLVLADERAKNLLVIEQNIAAKTAQLEILYNKRSDLKVEEAFNLRKGLNGMSAAAWTERIKALEATLDPRQREQLRVMQANANIEEIVRLNRDQGSLSDAARDTRINSLKSVLNKNELEILKARESTLEAIKATARTALGAVAPQSIQQHLFTGTTAVDEALDMIIFMASQRVLENFRANHEQQESAVNGSADNQSEGEESAWQAPPTTDATLFRPAEHRLRILKCLKEEFNLDANRISNTNAAAKLQISAALSEQRSLAELADIARGKDQDFDQHARLYLAQMLKQTTADLQPEESFKFSFGTKGVVDLTPIISTTTRLFTAGSVAVSAGFSMAANNSVEVACKQEGPNKVYDVTIMHGKEKGATAGFSGFYGTLGIAAKADASKAEGYVIRFTDAETCAKFMENLTGEDKPKDINTFGHAGVTAIATRALGAGVTANAGTPDPVRLFSAKGIDLGIHGGVEAEASAELAWSTTRNADVQTHSATRTFSGTIKTSGSSDFGADNINDGVATALEKLGIDDPSVQRGYTKSRTITMQTEYSRLTDGSHITETSTVIGKQTTTALLAVMPKVSISTPGFMEALEALRLKADGDSVFSVRYAFSAEAIERYNHDITYPPAGKSKEEAAAAANKILQQSLRPVSISVLGINAGEATAAVSSGNRNAAQAAFYAPIVNKSAQAKGTLQTVAGVIKLDDWQDPLAGSLHTMTGTREIEAALLQKA